MLTGEKWARGPGSPPEVKGLVWYTDGAGLGSMGSLWEEGSISL